MMRLMVSVASRVWSVDITRWPVSAAVSAVSMVSRSRISPTRMTSGSWRRALFSACPKLMVSTPTSRWFTIERLSRMRNSIGSSIVMMWQVSVALMWSIIAASVVDLPEPVVPVTRMRPRCSRGDLLEDLRQHELLDGLDPEGDDAEHHADGAALLEDVDAEAAEAGDAVGEVDLVGLLELLLLVVVHDPERHPRDLLGRQAAGVLQRDERAVDAEHRRQAGLEVDVAGAGPAGRSAGSRSAP